MSSVVGSPSLIHQLPLSLGDQQIPIRLGHDTPSQTGEWLLSLEMDSFLCVVDRAVRHHTSSSFLDALAEHTHVMIVTVEAYEGNKVLSTVEHLLEQAVALGATRGTAVIGVGGGLVGNVAGTVAALLYRGRPLIHVPTTLLAMSDSVLSAKQAVNGASGKNLYGAYLTPAAIVIDSKYLETLALEHMSAGLVELVKNVLSFCPEDLPSLWESVLEWQYAGPAKWEKWILMGVSQKQRLLRADPTERGRGMVLEYGHTVGHALELLCGGMSHGHAVAIGMMVAARIAWGRGWLDDTELALHGSIIRACGAPTAFPSGVPTDVLLARLGSDNKRFMNTCDGYPFVLLRGIGKVSGDPRLPLTVVSASEVVAAIDWARGMTSSDIHSVSVRVSR